MKIVNLHTHHLTPRSGPCNSFNCLGHFKNVYDDGDDDDDDDDDIAERSTGGKTPWSIRGRSMECGII